jgi:chemotaxis protein methyltransferase CheR
MYSRDTGAGPSAGDRDRRMEPRVIAERPTPREFDAFLRRLLEETGFSWAGYRKVRRRLRPRILNRAGALELESPEAYLARVRDDPAERAHLRALLAVTISRFFRDRETWSHLARRGFPLLDDLRANSPGRPALRALSLGCACGEEPYTLRMLWDEERPRARLEVLGVDILEKCLDRARRGSYPPSALRDLPERFRERHFERSPEGWRLRPDLRDGVRFHLLDLLGPTPWPGGAALILARYGPFTYLEDAGRAEVLDRVRRSLLRGGLLVLGARDSLPPGAGDFEDLGGGILRWTDD